MVISTFGHLSPRNGELATEASRRGLPAPPGGLGGLFGGGEESSSSSAGGLGGGLGGLFDETQTDGKTKGPMKLGREKGEKSLMIT